MPHIDFRFYRKRDFRWTVTQKSDIKTDFFIQPRRSRNAIHVIERRKKNDRTWPCATDSVLVRGQGSRERWSSFLFRYPRRWPKKQPCRLRRPRNTCYAQWSNITKVTRKTSLQRVCATRPRSLVEIAFTEPSCRGLPRAVPRLKIPPARKPVLAWRFAEEGSTKISSPPLARSSLLLLSLSLYLFFSLRLVMPLDESTVRPSSGAKDGAWNESRACAQITGRDMLLPRITSRKSRGSDYARKPGSTIV